MHTKMNKERNNTLLQDVREFLSSPEKWTKVALARDSNRNVVDVQAPGADSFCLLGAMCYCAGLETDVELADKYGDEVQLLEQEIAENPPVGIDLQGSYGIGHIWRFNDLNRTSHGDVIDLLNRTLLRKS